tara:strand:+ start:2008 stop:2487 length:480 start_codon:yes stop_codon:yes gene_type:complete
LKRKELYWILGTSILVIILNLFFFGKNAFIADGTININIHDTYFVLANLHFVSLLSIFVFFIVYLIRSIINRYENVTVNIVLIATTIALILIIGGIISISDMFSQSFNTPENFSSTGAKSPVSEILNNLSKILFYVQIVLLVLLAYSGFKAGQNYKRIS